MAMNGKLWVSEHSGKMTGINSIGTSCANNPHCKKRREDNESVCHHCYASTYMKIRKALKERLEDNAKILTTELLEGRDIPVTNANIMRFESFGDLYNSIHLENYVRICERNPYTHFALWSKNTWILNDVFNTKEIKKPENLSIVVSSPKLNEVMKLDRESMWYVDHVFTVYDKKFIEENGVKINCGSRDCLGCQRCYHRNTEFYVNEKLK